MKFFSWLRGDKIEKMLIALATPELDYEPLNDKLRQSEADRALIEQRLQAPSGVTLADLLTGVKHD